ncbi:MAG: energy-coupling factor transporter ATPase [Oscillospiraceae bacterium]|nr:energy-coupling factor transporter ATPase [Oscillospiraceae bacterium]
MPLIRTEKLTHTYSIGTPFERVAVLDVDFEMEKGEYLAIIGHTGSGKSTFIQHLNGLLKPNSGRVFFEERDIHDSKDWTRQVRFMVGIVFQYPEYQLFESTLYDDIAFGPRNMGLSENEVHLRVMEAAGFASIDISLMDKSPFELSGGLKRRAAIAGVIAMQPQVLVLDEPTAGLDPQGREEIISNINEYKRAHDATIIMVTHNMEEVAKNVNRIVIFENGGIVMDGSPGEVFSQSERLLEMDLSPPQATLIAQQLIKLGLKIDKDIYTLSQLRFALNKLQSHKNN